MPLRPLRDALASWKPGRVGPIDPLQAIALAWTGIVGRDVAANSRPCDLNGSTLRIETASSSWSQQLHMLSPAIVAGVNAIEGLPPVERLLFRTGLRRGVRAGAPRARPEARRGPGSARSAPPQPAADPAEALARLRRRIAAVRRSHPAACTVCGAPLGAGLERCAPCESEAAILRQTELSRLIYAAPWLGLAEIREQLPQTTPAEYERVRRLLLARWWTVLERARRAKTLGRAGIERQIASSYVLLHSRLRPDRVSPAVVRNLLGAELEALLWPRHASKAPAAAASKMPDR